MVNPPIHVPPKLTIEIKKTKTNIYYIEYYSIIKPQSYNTPEHWMVVNAVNSKKHNSTFSK